MTTARRRFYVLLIALATVAVALAMLGALTRPALPMTAQIGYPRLAGRALKAARVCLADTSLVSQARLASLSGVSATKISRVERGLDTLTVAESDRLYRVLAPMVRARMGDVTFVWLYVVHQRNARTP